MRILLAIAALTALVGCGNGAAAPEPPKDREEVRQDFRIFRAEEKIRDLEERLEKAEKVQNVLIDAARSRARDAASSKDERSPLLDYAEKAETDRRISALERAENKRAREER